MKSAAVFSAEPTRRRLKRGAFGSLVDLTAIKRFLAETGPRSTQVTTQRVGYRDLIRPTVIR